MRVRQRERNVASVSPTAIATRGMNFGTSNGRLRYNFGQEHPEPEMRAILLFLLGVPMPLFVLIALLYH